MVLSSLPNSTTTLIFLELKNNNNKMSTPPLPPMQYATHPCIKKTYSLPNKQNRKAALASPLSAYLRCFDWGPLDHSWRCWLSWSPTSAWIAAPETPLESLHSCFPLQHRESLFQHPKGTGGESCWFKKKKKNVFKVIWEGRKRLSAFFLCYKG